ncbi:MAG: hypothetical protein DMG55_13120 [Acidobacteria bacterium]|nr:MAG: hypothetical protein DMG55_13120 [Acidobacteriota bacterium]
MYMHDPRLIGSWRSDAHKTSLEIAARRDITAAKKNKLLRFFGKLELRYTPTRCYSSLNGQTSVNRYRVVAKDSWSVAVLVSNPIVGEQIVHIHFEGNYYWIVLGSGRMREFFKRLSSESSAKSKKRAKSR